METFRTCGCDCNFCEWLLSGKTNDYSDYDELGFLKLMPVDVFIDYQIHIGKEHDKLTFDFNLSKAGREDIISMLEDVDSIHERIIKCISFLGGYQWGFLSASGAVK